MSNRVFNATNSVVKQTGTAYSGIRDVNAQYFPFVQASDLPGGDDIRAFFGTPQWQFAGTTPPGENIGATFEIEAPLFTDAFDVISVPLAGYISSQIRDLVTGESISLSDTSLITIPAPQYYRVQWLVNQSMTTVPLDLANAVLELRPSDALPFVASVG